MVTGGTVREKKPARVEERKRERYCRKPNEAVEEKQPDQQHVIPTNADAQFLQNAMTIDYMETIFQLKFANRMCCPS